MSKGICMVCGHELEYDEIKDYCWPEPDATDSVDGFTCKTIKCPFCGTEYNCYVPEEEIDPGYAQPVNDQGFGNCPFCGGVLCWGADFMRSDMYGEELPDEDDGIVRSLTCSGCGTDFTVWEPIEKEMPGYPFWQNVAQ